MDFKQLTSFVTVVRCGSFSKAAEALFISQPGISAHVAALEKELGTPLFERTAKPLALTEAGKELLEYAQNLLKLRDRMYSVGKSTGQPVIHVGASTIPSAYYLPELLCSYSRAFPGTGFRITRSDSAKTLRGLSEGLFDVAFVGMERAEPGITFFPVDTDRMVLICPNTEEYRVLLDEKEPWRALLSKPLILREEGSASGAQLSRLTESLGVDPINMNVVASTDDTEAIKAMAAGGMGVACVSEKAVREDAGTGKLLVFDLPEHVSTRQLYLARSDLRTLRPVVASFIRFALEGSKGS